MRYIALGFFAALPLSAAFASELPDEPQAIVSSQTPIEASETSSLGYRINDASGFQLIEHGHWAPPLREEVAEHLANDGGQRGQLKTTPQPKPKKPRTNFRRAAFLPHVYAAETRFGLPVGLLDALIWTESRYDPTAVSHAGAAGLGQLMPGTAKDLGVTNRFDPYANISGAARYLRQMLDRFGVVHLAVAAYNAGPGAVSRVRGIPLNGETPSYVRNVLTFWQN
ncbi:lytic transglycosylase domain-containing protein [Sphingorhabdus pulchriflava]|jgi:soluble lytic murein transglycosylase-like protein|uniref:Lytic transglycosylase domain-containing protein n=1 Tax=Sphingorhabdus pulchriflava TaxID=2292257 RepID=A0A371BIV3_9SPHN|nr:MULTISPECIES: lytic transglycosylase domain-containing protein [Sphingorhabdus]RDV07457.1 lytic transglycosylase domain-containing protein [Sphingorhabdus pulchriflava]HMT40866.1 lytic transglycosylase domain-containing protein [Sphingorhabdus sp.]HMU22088.1 lytic transglycosylase domain-containing protein [Sphingorhabdus sp.]